ncbi:MAG: hypothetical protein B7Z37_17660 [Verrucomicrobia bacterium 12-59-8]|nr:MAG: hypothetical protein B7Z37_17660 [Verrucomicrobia bacterium 12-59-8]
MPAGHLVRPQKWSSILDLYDDGTNSAIWGSYEEDADRCLGVRWNDGYPSQGGNPLWYVEPDFATKNILLELLDRVNGNPSWGNLNNILTALREHQP